MLLAPSPVLRSPMLFLGVVTLAVGCSSDGGSGLASSGGSSGSVGVPTIVTNAAVFTVDPDGSTAEAFSYGADGIIMAVGSEEHVRRSVGDDVVVIDAGARMVLPGFQDTHVHVPEAGINESSCLMPGGLELSEYADLVADCAGEQAGVGWVRAAGASLFELRGTEESPLDVLDRVIPDRPAAILDDLGHAVWTNSLGLQAAGIGPDDPDPQGGILHRDRDGRLTGLLLENAQHLVRSVAAPSDDATYEGLLAALDTLARNGLTTISDAGGYWAQNHPTAWQRALEDGTLNVRAVNSLYVYPDLEQRDQLLEFERRFSDDPNSLLKFNTAKIYLDGILDLGTAALIDPYDKPIDPEFPSGFNYFRTGQIQSYAAELHALGYRLEFHVIGDAATRDALDAIEGIDADRSEIAERRHRTTHTYMVHPDDVSRFNEIGVVADFQVGPDSTDTRYHEILFGYIGDRALDLIPVRTMIDAGAAVSLSSDWDADPLSPLGTIQRSLTRESNAVEDIETAIELVTIDAAYALGHDDVTGSIEVGKYADFVVLDQNILDSDIDDATVLLTVLAGEETYRSSRFD